MSAHAYSTVQMGVLLMALGAAWFLFGYSWIYSVALLLLALGVIAIASAMRRTEVDPLSLFWL